MSESLIVVLVGGPPETPRLWVAPSDEDMGRIKIPRGNGYEHFEFADEYVDLDGDRIPVYRWRYRTFIAE